MLLPLRFVIIAMRIFSTTKICQKSNTGVGVPAIFAIITSFLITFVWFMIITIWIFSTTKIRQKSNTGVGVSAIFAIIAVLFISIIWFMMFSMRVFSATEICQIPNTTVPISTILTINICHDYFPFLILAVNNYEKDYFFLNSFNRVTAS